jgi:hypothetical protein
MSEINNSNPSAQWSEADASNTAPAPDGFPVSSTGDDLWIDVPQNGRALMGAIKRFWDRINGTVNAPATAGTYSYAPAYPGTPPAPFPSAYVQGETYSFKAMSPSVGGDTLNVNVLGAMPLYKPRLSGPVTIAAGDIKANQMVQAVYDGGLNGGSGGFQITSALASTGDVVGPASSTNNDIVLFDGSSGAAIKDSGFMLRDLIPVGQCRLQYVSATQINLVPFNGCLIKIAGALYQLPAAGTTAANTGVYVNGTAGRDLAANTLYYVYLFNSSGTLTIDFSTTGHATDTTAGNVGVEIESGNNSRTLIGLIYTNGSKQFAASAQFLGVRSWFNRAPLQGAADFTDGTTSGTFTVIDAGAQFDVIVFADDLLHVDIYGEIYLASLCAADSQIWIDGAPLSGAGQSTRIFNADTSSSATTYGFSMGVRGVLSEGHHIVNLAGAVEPAGSGPTWYWNTVVAIG